MDSIYTLSPIGGEGRVRGQAVRGQVREHLQRYAHRLRRKQTDAERRLWSRLRDRRLAGARFRRQHPIGPFIADFCCTEAKLVIELDGGQHALQQKADRARTEFFESQGYAVRRFWDNEIFTNIDGILQRIIDALSAKGSRPSPCPLPRGERDPKRPTRMKPSPHRGDGRGRA